MTKFFQNRGGRKPYKFFIKLLIFLLLLHVIDFTAGSILRHYYFRQQSGLQYRTTYSIEKTKADVLIFGSSRANHHYRPDVFENFLHLSFYNAGRDGEFMFYHYAVLKGVLKRYTPKIVMLDFRMTEFDKKQEKYDRLSALLPYYETHTEMRSIIRMKSPFEKLKLLSFMYPFNSSMFTIAIGNTNLNKKRSEDFEGYVPLTKQWNEPIQVNKDPIDYIMDTAEVSTFKSFVTDCVNAKVKLYIICSPYYIVFNNRDKSLSTAAQIAKENNIDFFNYSNDTAFTNHHELFADKSHLNEDGAKKFSNIIVNKISESVNH